VVLGPPTIWVPHFYPACSQRAPNEHMLASVAREGLQIMTGLFWDLGAPEFSPPLKWRRYGRIYAQPCCCRDISSTTPAGT
jgi:hypothetical protein